MPDCRIGQESDQIRNRKDGDIAVGLELSHEALCRLVVQRFLRGIGHDQHTHHDNQTAVGAEMLRFIFNVPEKNLVHVAVGRDLIAEIGMDAELLDLGFQSQRPLLIVRDVIELDVLETAAERAVQGLQERAVQGLDRKDDLA